MADNEIYIKVTKDGPYFVYGKPLINEKIIISDNDCIAFDYADGRVFEVKSEPVCLCRCGKTKTPPFCDGTHNNCNFDGTETASFEPFINNAVKYEGKNLVLYVNEKYCALARFCDAYGTIWNLILNGDKKSDELAIKEADLCPSGRLIMYDKEGNILEKKLPAEISVLEDPCYRVSGPLRLQGNIRVESADGRSYEIRTKQTLCRCGNSANKPFCDCSHKHKNFKAEK